MKSYTGNTSLYYIQKKNILSMFFNLLPKNKDLPYLCKKDKNGREHMYSLCGEEQTDRKKNILNTLLSYWVNSSVKKEYQDKDMEKVSKEEFAHA